MGKETNIQWCDHTWSPWLGCRKVSEECDNCSTPFRVRGIEHGSRREELSEAYWRQPMTWQRLEVSGGAAHHGAIPPRVFPSLCDWLDKEVPIRLLARFLKLIHDTPNLDWLLLTKRIQNFDRIQEAVVYMVCQAWDSRVIDWLIHWQIGGSVPDNVWLGVSAGTQKAANDRIPQLLKIPARIRFLSVEPMLEEVNLAVHDSLLAAQKRIIAGKGFPVAVDWVIVGGESGAKARPCNVDWIRDIVRQCQAAGVPCFVKQLGKFCLQQIGDRTERVQTSDSKGGNMAEWPEDLRVRQFPEAAR